MPTEEERVAHSAYCRKLYVTEGMKGLVRWGAIGGVVIAASHYLSMCIPYRHAVCDRRNQLRRVRA
jgi:hypothetical protein